MSAFQDYCYFCGICHIFSYFQSLVTNEFIFQEKLTFKEVWINCMSLNQSTNIYQKIAAEITNEELTCKESEKYLERLFEKGDQKM